MRVFARRLAVPRVRLGNRHEGECPDLELLDNRPDESLFVEAWKS